MTFEERKSVAREMLMAFLGRFTPPRGMDEDGQVAMVSAIADAFARKMPVVQIEEYRDRVGEVLTKVADSQSSYAWPPQGAFVEAMPRGYGAGRAAPETFKSSDSTLAKAIRDGDAIPEIVVWGHVGQSLVSAGDVSAADLEAYRAGSVRSWRGVYGDGAMDLLEARYGAEVRRYRMEVV